MVQGFLDNLIDDQYIFFTCLGLYEYNGPQNLNQLLRDIESAKAKFRFIPEKEVHEKELQWEV